MDDRRLVEHLIQRDIALEVCPSSNVCTGAVASMAEHPIGQLLEDGVLVTVNTDDPPMFGTTLTKEYQYVADTFNLNVDQVSQLVTNGVRASFLPEHRKRTLYAQIEHHRRASQPAN